MLIFYLSTVHDNSRQILYIPSVKAPFLQHNVKMIHNYLKSARDASNCALQYTNDSWNFLIRKDVQYIPRYSICRGEYY